MPLLEGGKLSQYIIRRSLVAIPTLLAISFVMFLLLDLAPGNPLDAMVRPEQGGLSQETYEYYRARFGLDKPFLIRYFYWLKEVFRGNLGIRTVNFRPVAEELAPRLKNTLILASSALFLGVTLGIMIGIVSAIFKYSILDYVITITAFGSLSVPVFFMAFLLIYVFTYLWPVLPAAGTTTVGAENSVLDYVRHLILPMLALSTVEVATFTRYMRSGLLKVLSEDYIRTAAAKGLAHTKVLLRHALRNALTTVITMIGFRLQVLVAGAVVVESVFNWPGMGSMFLEGVHGRDFPLIMGYTLVFAVAIVISNLLVDIAYGIIDPRVSYD